MGRRRADKLSLYRRGRVWYVAAREKFSGRVLTMTLREINSALAAARHAQLEAAWRRGEPIFPGQAGAGIPGAGAGASAAAGTLGAAVEGFLAFRQGRVEDGTLINDRCRLRRFVAAFPGMTVAALNRRQVEDWLSGILAKQSKRTHNQYLVIARKFLAWAASHAMRPDNPAGHLKPLPVDQDPIEYLTLEQRTKVLAAAARTRYGAMVATALHCGLRLGELQRLRWDDVDLKARTLLVRESKTGKPRQVPMPRALVAILKKLSPQRTQSARRTTLGDGVCFPVHVPECLPEQYRAKHAGDAVEGNLKEYMAELSKAVGIRVNWLICRHTFGSLLAQKGVSLLKIAKWMGHDKPETTVRHYATLAPGYDEDVEV